MVARYYKIIFFISVCILLSFIGESHDDSSVNERRMKVIMRKIGHEILLTSGDSTSRVLAIEKEEDRYKIEFENEFGFNPGELAFVIKEIVGTSGIANSYLVEVEDCKTESVIYSYEIGSPAIPLMEMVPCGGRVVPKGCHQVFFTVLDSSQVVVSKIITTPPTSSTSSKKKEATNYSMFLFLLIPFAIFFAWFFYKQRNNVDSSPKVTSDSNIVPIGAFQFDKRNMALLHEDTRTELTSKEADLLLLLLSSSNITLERENILKKVWGDEGDYIGRTLDVFISKLRKKLAADSNLKIVNIRGVGYKFVVNA